MHSGLRLLGPLVSVCLLGACSIMQSLNSPPDTSDRVAASEAMPTEAAAFVPEIPAEQTPLATPIPAAETVTPARGIPRTVVIVSADIPAYAEIADEMLRRSPDNVTVHTLTAQTDDHSRVIADIVNIKPRRIVAIGLRAAIAARAVPDTPTVFCQVYNYQDHDLVSATSKGVYLLPPFGPQLREWRRLTPGIERIGVITGPGHDGLIREMQQAAETFGIALATRTVHTDREALHAFKELAPVIDGLWLLPDNRILSPDIVRDIFSYSAAHDKPVATFGDSLMEMGALLSSTGDPRDVVDRVLERFEAVDENGRLRGPDMVQLTAARTQVNGVVAMRMGLISLEANAAAP